MVSLFKTANLSPLGITKNLCASFAPSYENIVAEALRKSGLDLFYWKKENATLEQDFFVRTVKSLVPVEVKSERIAARFASVTGVHAAAPTVGDRERPEAHGSGHRVPLSARPAFSTPCGRSAPSGRATTERRISETGGSAC